MRGAGRAGLYEPLWQSHRSYEPVLRPMFAEFPDDPRCLADGDDMMLGASLLVAPVVEEGLRERAVYLPAGQRWESYWSGEIFEGGQTLALPAPFEQPTPQRCVLQSDAKVTCLLRALRCG